MRMRGLHPLARLIASLLFGLSVLAFFVFVSAEMASHFFQRTAERTIRQAFTEGTRSEDDARFDTVCRELAGDDARASACDPIAVKAERSLRSVACDSESWLRLLGKRWSCVAKFTDGAKLSVQVSLGFGRPDLELRLPFREPDAA